MRNITNADSACRYLPIHDPILFRGHQETVSRPWENPWYTRPVSLSLDASAPALKAILLHTYRKSWTLNG